MTWETRYSEVRMRTVWTVDTRHQLYRVLWAGLAAQQANLEMGNGIVKTADAELALKVASRRTPTMADIAPIEQAVQHETYAHLIHFSDELDKIRPGASKCLHLGVTSCYITDNADQMQMKMALENLISGIRDLLRQLMAIAVHGAERPTPGFTHGQRAEWTTVGKRVTMWMSDLLSALGQLSMAYESLRFNFRGVKGAVGSNSAMLQLFGGDDKKIDMLNNELCEFFEFTGVAPITGQTYSRRMDEVIMMGLASLASVMGKMGTDLRLWAQLGAGPELGDGYVGSSAMPYKKNPLYAERLCGLSRYVRTLLPGFMETSATQWMERSLDDSSFKRIAMQNAFLVASGLLVTAKKATHNFHVPELEDVHAGQYINEEATMCKAILAGVSRADIHNALRVFKQTGDIPDLVRDHASMEPRGERIGMCASQVHNWIAETLIPILAPDLQVSDDEPEEIDNVIPIKK